MSTKIHDGYRLTGLVPTPAFFAMIADLRARLEVVYERAYRAALVEEAVIHADRLLLGEGPSSHMADLPLADSSPLLCASFYIDKVWRESLVQGATLPQFDFQCEVFFLVDPSDQDSLYAIFSASRKDYREEWEATAGVEPWPYWDNVDRPDDVTDTEWEHRRDTWDRVIGWDVIQDRCVTWSLLGDSHVFSDAFDLEWLPPLLPDRATRARWVAERQVYARMSQSVGDVIAARDARAVEIEPHLAELTPEMLRLLPGVVL